MRLLRPTSLGALLALAGHALADLEFFWPQSVAQCEVVPVVILGGEPPYKLYMTPLDGQPIWFDLLPNAGEEANTTFWLGQRYYLQMQFKAGTYYTAWMSDASGVGGGGVTVVQQVTESSNTSCLETAQYNQTQNMFSFSLSGALDPCTDPSTGNGMRIEWNGSLGDAPYNATIIPCDQSYVPWEVPLNYTEDGQPIADWTVNMTSGSRFTVMMNNKFGRGTGGVANVYEVRNSSATCASQTRNAEAISWPTALTAQTLPAVTVVLNSKDDNSSLGHGAIAGIAVGSALAVALGSLAMLYVFRKRRQQNNGTGGQMIERGGRVDMVDKDENAPHVEPFMYEGVRQSTEELAPVRTDSSPNLDDITSPHTPFLTPSSASLKAEILNLTDLDGVPSSSGAPSSSSSRSPLSLVNATKAGIVQRRRREREPAFVRHADGGSVHEAEGIEPSGGVVDLPPMYTDVPSRTRDANGSRGVGAAGGSGGVGAGGSGGVGAGGSGADADADAGMGTDGGIGEGGRAADAEQQ